MTTSPVMSVTDELMAELEDELECCGSYNLDADEIAALLAERVELKRDAERYRLYRQGMADPEALDAAIDAAMQS